MSLPFNITREDLLRSKLVTPGWYDAKVVTVEQVPAKTDGSTNTNVEIRILGGGFEGVLIKRTFSEKAPSFAISFIEAVTGKPIGADGGQFDIEKSVDVKLKAYIKNEEYQNRMVNRAEDFRAIS